jgi:phosphate starvation-inducible protein PhoH
MSTDEVVKCTTVEHHLMLLEATADSVVRERVSGNMDFAAIRESLVQGMFEGDDLGGIISRVQAAEQEQETASTVVEGVEGGSRSKYISCKSVCQGLTMTDVKKEDLKFDVGEVRETITPAPATLDMDEVRETITRTPATLDLVGMCGTVTPPATGRFRN